MKPKCSKSIAAEIIDAIGLQYFLPLPMDKNHVQVQIRHLEFQRKQMLIINEPVIALASSDKISPNKFSVKITSNCLGFK
jgi:hypothetical protein